MTPAKFVEYKWSPNIWHLDLWCNTPAKFHSNPVQGCMRSWDRFKLKCVKILSVKDHNSVQNLSNIELSPHMHFQTCLLQHPCQVSFKSMQGCRRSWEDKLKCVKILNVKDHNSAKICRTWIISPHALLDLWCNIPAKFHVKSMQGCRQELRRQGKM